ncbi:MAG: hypothetical protein IRY96_07400 [Burkholderiales bacterium]|nr:hypothetical protein [Burkholderiales bacterium]
MRKTLVIIAALAGLALAPQAQAHDDRVGIFVVGAITGAVIGHVLGDHDHHHHHHHVYRPRVVEHHHHYVPRRPVREVHH